MKEKMRIKDIAQLIVLCITLFGGVYAYAESQIQIQENKEDIEEVGDEQKIIKGDVHELNTQSRLNIQSNKDMSDDIKEIKDLLKDYFKSQNK
tara:strand:- start:1075 stop:1353 length:279 start_codon:yes stop_codon:yes gene_type:complete